MSLNLATMLRESATAAPDKPLVHINDLSFTYAQVDEIPSRVASALLGLGLQQGVDAAQPASFPCPPPQPLQPDEVRSAVSGRPAGRWS
jgi:hypothetical protein